MDSQSIKEILNGLYSHLERLETQNTAILLFLKEKKRVTDKQLAPYLEQAGNAANVKWRAERVRMEYLLAQAPEESKPGKKTEKESAAAPEIEQAEQKSPETKHQTSGQEEQEQAAEGSDEGRENQEHQDSSRTAKVQSESSHELGGERKEGERKVA